MYKKSKILAIIPARGGSKGVPRKNSRLLAGKPLFVHSIEAALNVDAIDRIVVSTDDREIAGIAEEAGVAPLQRPLHLAGDETPMDPVLTHAVLFLEKEERYVPDVVVLLQPTSPLRTSAHISEAINIFANGDYDSLISICAITENRHELHRSGYLKPTFQEIQNRDKRPTALFENGAIYISNVDLIKQGKIRGEKIGHYLMDQYSSIDIDDMKDFEVCEKLLRSRNVNTTND